MPDASLDFDRERAKRRKPGEFIAFRAAPGLRLEGSRRGRRWTYRCRSPRRRPAAEQSRRVAGIAGIESACGVGKAPRRTDRG